MTDTSTLISRLEAGRSDNFLDVEIEVALFEPDDHYSAARANSAGTKVVYTLRDGRQETCWAADWSQVTGPHRAIALKALRASQAAPTQSQEKSR